MALNEDGTGVRTGDNEAAVAASSDESAPADNDPADAPSRSLYDDLESLLDDARTYFDAELSYQKNRAGFVGDRIKKGIAFALVAVVIVIFALIGLTVGLIIALTPLVTAWGATAIVVGGMLLMAYLAIRKAITAFREMSAAMKRSVDTEESEDDA